ncbi:hypothetical protein HRbin12_01046 [bacterium HR12]|nr:hypothetical protein HRbin12_01046 [bacterium HR12]
MLVTAGVFDLISGAPITHGGMLIAVAAALGLDAARRRATAAEVERARAIEVRASPQWLLGVVAYAVVVGSFERYSWPASVAVLVPAAAGVVLAWEGRTRERPSPPRIGFARMAPWAAVVVAFAAWELTNLFLQPSLTEGSYDHPTFSVLMDPILATHVGRSIVLTLWLLLGWFLLER